jgi:F-type H+-transporting ATPase subunit gamma
MANLKGVINYFVSSTMQITSAMKMVSATKLKKAKCNAMHTYAEKLTELLRNLSATQKIDAGGEFYNVK